MMSRWLSPEPIIGLVALLASLFVALATPGPGGAAMALSILIGGGILLVALPPLLQRWPGVGGMLYGLGGLLLVQLSTLPQVQLARPGPSFLVNRYITVPYVWAIGACLIALALGGRALAGAAGAKRSYATTAGVALGLIGALLVTSGHARLSHGQLFTQTLTSGHLRSYSEAALETGPVTACHRVTACQGLLGLVRLVAWIA